MDASSLRNVALLSHSGAGKTTLCEAALFGAGTVTRQGRIEDGNTVIRLRTRGNQARRQYPNHPDRRRRRRRQGEFPGHPGL